MKLNLETDASVAVLIERVEHEMRIGAGVCFDATHYTQNIEAYIAMNPFINVIGSIIFYMLIASNRYPQFITTMRSRLFKVSVHQLILFVL